MYAMLVQCDRVHAVDAVLCNLALTSLLQLITARRTSSCQLLEQTN